MHIVLRARVCYGSGSRSAYNKEEYLSMRVVNPVPFMRRKISFGVAVKLLAEGRNQTIGDCAKMLNISRDEMHRLMTGKWNISPQVANNTAGLLASTFE